MRDKFKQPYKENGNLYNSHYALQRGKLWDDGIHWRGSTLKALTRGSDSAFAEKPPPEHAIDIRLNKQNGLNDKEALRVCFKAAVLIRVRHEC